MRYHIEDIPIYKAKIAVCITNDPRELTKVFTRNSVEDTGILDVGFVHAHAMKLNHKGYVCFTVLFNMSQLAHKITQGTIAHEALHIMNMLFEERKIHYFYEHDEHSAYFINWVVDFIMQCLHKWKLLTKVTI